nr:helix-turn-helix domain-containing protein [uncultured Haemophilus sp.]
MNSIEFVERLKKVADVKEDQALAEIFGLSKASFSYAKKNNSFSAEMLSNFAERFNCDLHWLITGKENTPKLNEMETELLARFNRLSFSEKLDIFNCLQGSTASAQSVGGDGFNVGGDFNFNQK